jgi:hypothetical protein
MYVTHVQTHIVDIVRSIQTINTFVQPNPVGEQMFGNVLFETGQSTHLTIGEWAIVAGQMGHERFDDIEFFEANCK